ncbi:MAG TPA: protein kinase [Polyangiaceae bacterium]|jgi:serine/threonine-protein kinase
MTASPQALVGAVLSQRLRLKRVIGEGGMGVVFAAEAIAPLSEGSGKFPVDERIFAVKILRPEFLGDADVLSRFIEEGRTCQRLIHPNILRVFECAQAEDGTPYLVMELLDGVPLSAYTANGGRVPLHQGITILQGILAGLAAAHAQGIVHRDLKPENVFLAREVSGQFQIKLLDFGIAKVMDAAGGMGSRTRTGAFLGTPAYMSPEQIKNPRDVDPRTDLWSAGVMTWEMLSGRVAFPAPTEYARLAAVMTNTPDTLEKVEPALAPISPIVQRAMEKDPARRFASAMEMVRAVSAIAAVQGTAAHDPARGHPTPLSRLPAVPSIFAPSSGISPGASSERHTPVAPEHGQQGGSITGPVPTAAILAARPSGSTLQSAAPPAVQLGTPATPLPPRVVVVESPLGSTMPSHDLPVLEPPPPSSRSTTVPILDRQIVAWVVLILVVGAFGAGVALGMALALARSM